MIKSIAKFLVLISAAFCIGVGVTFAPPAESALEWYCWSEVTDFDSAWYIVGDEICYDAIHHCCHLYTKECNSWEGYACFPPAE